MSIRREPGQEEVQRAILSSVVFVFLAALLVTLMITDNDRNTPVCVSDEDRAEAGILTDIQNPANDCHLPTDPFVELYLKVLWS